MADRHLQIGPSPKLMESMRSLGYSPEVAVADVIDNSIDARASDVRVAGDVSGSPAWVWICDDGCGMTLEGMKDALTLGATSSVDGRDADDLGRFGLGLKTATFSQCRRLTLVSRVHGEPMRGLRFDLDEMQEAGDWRVRSLEAVELREVPGIDALSDSPSGTLVCWQKLDRLLGEDTTGGSDMARTLNLIREHLALTFHRWIAPDSAGDRKVALTVNGRRVEATDPFIRHNRAVGSTERETLTVGDDRIGIQAFTLPDSSKITGPDADRHDLGEGMFKGQGFYFYRNRRLISHGGWANLGGRRDVTKHSRVLIDLPNSTDSTWQLDVMKNKITPPASIRRQLQRFYDVGRRESSRVITYRGRRADSGDVEYAWIPIEERSGFRYEPNPLHPVLADALDGLSASQRGRIMGALRHLGLLIPYADIRRRMSIDDETPMREHRDSVVAEAVRIMQVLRLDWRDTSSLHEVLGSVEPFAGRRDLKAIVVSAQEHQAAQVMRGGSVE